MNILKQHSEALKGTVYTSFDTVRIILVGNPFRTERVEYNVLAGLSIAEILAQASDANARPDLASSVIVYIDGHTVPSSNWKTVRPKRGTTVVLRAVAEGPLVAGVAAVFSAITAAVSAASAFIGGLGLLGQVVMAGVALGAQFLLNALFPVRQPSLSNTDNERGRQAFSISGSRNSAAPFESVPVVYGSHRVTPYYGALPYTESFNDDQYFRGLFVWCYGPATLSDLRIGETPLARFADFEIEHRNGYASDTELELFNSQVVEEPLSIELEREMGFVSRTSAPNITEISADIVFPSGLYQIDKESGNKVSYRVVLEGGYRRVGTSSWTSFPSMSVSLRSLNPVRRTFRATVPEGQYEIRVRRVTVNDADHTFKRMEPFSTTILVAIRGARPRAPITFPSPLVRSAIRIRANQQLNGSLDSLNGLVTARVARGFNGSSWVSNVPSRNPADIIRHVLQGPANARPVPDIQIDLPALEGFWRYCRDKGYSFDAIVTSPKSVFDMVADVAAAGRAVPLFKDGKWSVVWDEASTNIVQMFTPRNSWGFETTRAFPQIPHAFKVRFINRAKGFVEDERVVYDDGYDETNATLFESIEFPGVTDADNVWKHGRFQLAQLKLRPEIVSINADWESLICTRGDRVRVQHDVMLIGQTSGRVTGHQDGHLHLDETITVERGKRYTFRWRTEAFETLSVVFSDLAAGEYRKLPWTGTVPQPDALFSWGEAGIETAVYRVLSVASNSDFTARITLVDDAPEISQADTGEIPEFQSNVSRPVDPFLLPPSEITSNQEAYELGGVWYAQIYLSWMGTRIGRVSSFELGMMDTEANVWTTLGRTPATQTSFTVPDLSEGVYRFRVRAIFEDGTFSDWTVSQDIYTTSLIAPPDRVENFSIAVLNDLSTLAWNNVSDASYYEIRYVAEGNPVVWNSATPVAPRITGTNIQVPTMIGTYLIKAVKGNGIRSREATAISTNVDSLSGHNVIEVLHETGFPGNVERLTKNVNYIRLAPKVVSGETYAEVDGYYYFAQTLDLTEIYTSRLSSSILAEGSDLTNAMSRWPSLSAVALLDNASPDDWGVEMQFRSTLENPANDNWSDWKTLLVGDVTARAFEFRLKLSGVPSEDEEYSDVTPLVRSLSVTVDMPDRVAAGNDISVPIAGRRIAFEKPFAAIPAVAASGQNMNSDDSYIISNKTKDGFDIHFFNASNSPVAATFDYVAKGYGGAS